jgi:hypothetical protein
VRRPARGWLGGSEACSAMRSPSPRPCTNSPFVVLEVARAAAWAWFPLCTRAGRAGLRCWRGLPCVRLLSCNVRLAAEDDARNTQNHRLPEGSRGVAAVAPPLIRSAGHGRLAPHLGIPTNKRPGPPGQQTDGASRINGPPLDLSDPVQSNIYPPKAVAGPHENSAALPLEDESVLSHGWSTRCRPRKRRSRRSTACSVQRQKAAAGGRGAPRPPAGSAGRSCGADATGDMPNVFSRFTGRVKEAVDDVTPG